jgi:hypothetical protein
MERNTYLQKILQCAKLKETGLPGVKKDVPDALRVVYKGIEYYPFGYSMYANPDGTWRHTAVLHDVKANAVVSAPLMDVEAKEK